MGFLVAVPQVGHSQGEKNTFQFLQHLDVCSPQIGSTGSPPASSCSTPPETSTSMTTMTRLPWRRTARRRAPQVPSLFLVVFLSWCLRSHGRVGVGLTSFSLCPPVTSPTHAGLPVDDARFLPHLSQLGAVRLPLPPLLLFLVTHLPTPPLSQNFPPAPFVTPVSSSSPPLISSPSLRLPGLPAVLLSGAVRRPSSAPASSVRRPAGPPSQTPIRGRGGGGGDAAARNLPDVHG